MLCRSMQAMLPDQSGLLTDVHKSLSCSFAFLVCCFCVILLFFFPLLLLADRLHVWEGHLFCRHGIQEC